jgi:hypothetical protein
MRFGLVRGMRRLILLLVFDCVFSTMHGGWRWRRFDDCLPCVVVVCYNIISVFFLRIVVIICSFSPKFSSVDMPTYNWCYLVQYQVQYDGDTVRGRETRLLCIRTNESSESKKNPNPYYCTTVVPGTLEMMEPNRCHEQKPWHTRGSLDILYASTVYW